MRKCVALRYDISPYFTMLPFPCFNHLSWAIFSLPVSGNQTQLSSYLFRVNNAFTSTGNVAALLSKSRKVKKCATQVDSSSKRDLIEE